MNKKQFGISSKGVRWMMGFAIVSILLASAYLSLRASPHMKEIPWIPKALAQWADEPRYDEIRTAVPFSALGFLLGLITPLHRKGIIIMVLMAGSIALFLGLLEWAQMLLPSRNADWADVGWGWLGLGGSLVLGWGGNYLARRFLKMK